ncbi:hypothetical protein ACQB6R_08500 [Propionibacteriaceae bacterium G1746]
MTSSSATEVPGTTPGAPVMVSGWTYASWLVISAGVALVLVGDFWGAPYRARGFESTPDCLPGCTPGEILAAEQRSTVLLVIGAVLLAAGLVINLIATPASRRPTVSRPHHPWLVALASGLIATVLLVAAAVPALYFYMLHLPAAAILALPTVAGISWVAALPHRRWWTRPRLSTLLAWASVPLAVAGYLLVGRLSPGPGTFTGMPGYVASLVTFFVALVLVDWAIIALSTRPRAAAPPPAPTGWPAQAPADR